MNWRRFLCWLNWGHIPRFKKIVDAPGTTCELSCNCGAVVESRITFPGYYEAKNA